MGCSGILNLSLIKQQVVLTPQNYAIMVRVYGQENKENNENNSSSLYLHGYSSTKKDKFKQW
jgi:hypothetical protein